MSITTTIPSEVWVTLVNALWWGTVFGIGFKGLSWIGYACAAIVKADSIGHRK